jgi:FkbM family methyltransferase
MDQYLNKIEKLYEKFSFTTETYSQLGQDVLALFCFENTPGYFVEFGACDGIIMSNTFLLETYHGWNGILVEPVPYYNRVLKNKRDCIIVDDVCVSDKSDEIVKFMEVRDFQCVSGMTSDAFKDSWAGIRKSNANTFDVKTISLKDLLDNNNAPQYIEFLSVDTEGSEFKILNAYDFSREFGLITVEHNHTENKELIEKLLQEKGYIQILHNKSRHDSWFVSEKVYNSLIKRKL